MEFISELVKTEYTIFLWIVVAFTSIAGFLASIKGFFEFISWIKKVKEERANDFNFAKRTTIKTAAGLVFLGVAWSSGLSLYRSYPNSKMSFIVKYNKKLVANKKTGTIHLKGVSSGAFPSKKWESKNIDLYKNKPYSGSSRRIYEEIAKEALLQKNDLIAIKAYIMAIEVSPLSYHLYDKLTRIYGRKKEYTNIENLYNNALLILPKLSLNKRSYKRANKEFTMRMQRTKHRTLLT